MVTNTKTTNTTNEGTNLLERGDELKVATCRAEIGIVTIYSYVVHICVSNMYVQHSRLHEYITNDAELKVRAVWGWMTMQGIREGMKLGKARQA